MEMQEQINSLFSLIETQLLRQVTFEFVFSNSILHVHILPSTCKRVFFSIRWNSQKKNDWHIV